MSQPVDKQNEEQKIRNCDCCKGELKGTVYLNKESNELFCSIDCYLLTFSNVIDENFLVGEWKNPWVSIL